VASASISGAVSTWKKLRIVGTRGHLSAYVDGVLQFTGCGDISNAGTASFVGLHTNDAAAEFRNIKLWTLTGGAPA
jgi:hypothetical protein